MALNFFDGTISCGCKFKTDEIEESTTNNGTTIDKINASEIKENITGNGVEVKNIKLPSNVVYDNIGGIKYNGENIEYNDGSRWNKIPRYFFTNARKLYVSSSESETGKGFSNIADCVTYINAQSPSETNKFIIELLPGDHIITSDITLSNYTALIGNNKKVCKITLDGYKIICPKNEIEISNLCIYNINGTSIRSTRIDTNILIDSCDFNTTLTDVNNNQIISITNCNSFILKNSDFNITSEIPTSPHIIINISGSVQNSIIIINNLFTLITESENNISSMIRLINTVYNPLYRNIILISRNIFRMTSTYIGSSVKFYIIFTSKNDLGIYITNNDVNIIFDNDTNKAKIYGFVSINNLINSELFASNMVVRCHSLNGLVRSYISHVVGTESIHKILNIMMFVYNQNIYGFLNPASSGISYGCVFIITNDKTEKHTININGKLFIEYVNSSTDNFTISSGTGNIITYLDNNDVQIENNLLVDQINAKTTNITFENNLYATNISVGTGNNLQISGNQIIENTSSQKYKEDIKKINISDFVDDLNPVSFKYKNTNNLSFGLIAEELEKTCIKHKINPEYFINYKNNEPNGINENSIIMILIDEIKKLKKLILEK